MKWLFTNWFQKYKLHILIWAIYIFYETVVVGLVFGVFGHPITYITHYIAIFFLFYIHGDILFPWSIKEGKAAFWRIPFILVLEVTVFVLISFGIDKSLIFFRIMAATGQFNLTYLYFLKISYRAIYFWGFATGYYYLVTSIKVKKRTNELEKQHLMDIIERQKTTQELTKAQNAFLKAQINPHFLFNTLDFIYHNIDASAPVAADAVIVLTEMMRFAIDADKMGDYIYLGEEIDQAENLIYLSQMRKNHNLALKFNYTDNVRQIKLIPLVLLTLLENIFKHGNLNYSEDEAIIEIYLENDNFHITTYNLITDILPKAGSYTGLKNIEQRLKFAYGSMVQFNCGPDDNNHFRVHAEIPVKALTNK